MRRWVCYIETCLLRPRRASQRVAVPLCDVGALAVGRSLLGPVSVRASERAVSSSVGRLLARLGYRRGGLGSCGRGPHLTAYAVQVVYVRATSVGGDSVVVDD